jgi:hypothetical protein
MSSNENYTILVSDVSIPTDELAKFFGFCGNVVHLKTEAVEKDTFKAFITFDNSQSYLMALALNGTLMKGKAIKIEPAVNYVPPQTTQPKVQPQPQQELPSGLRTMTSIMSTIIANGYKLGQDALNKAKEFDEKIGLVDKLKDTTTNVKKNVEQLGTQVDEKLHINEKLTEVQTKIKDTTTNVKKNVEQLGTQVEEKLHINEKISGVQTKLKEVEQKLDIENRTKQLGEQTTNFFTNVGSGVEQFISSHETLQKGVDQAKQLGQNVGQFLTSKKDELTGTVNNVINQTSTQVQNKINQETQQVPEKI